MLQVILKPYLVWNDRSNNPATLGGPGPEQPPTASPPLLSLEGGLEFRVYNNATRSNVSPPLSMRPCQHLNQAAISLRGAAAEHSQAVLKQSYGIWHIDSALDAWCLLSCVVGTICMEELHISLALPGFNLTARQTCRRHSCLFLAAA